MAVKASIVVSFTGSGILTAELDEILNVDNNFNPGDEIYIGIYSFPNTVHYNDPISSSGQCGYQYQIERTVSERIQFADNGSATLSYLAISDFNVVNWYGREGSNISAIGNTVNIDEGWPCIADVTYTTRVDIWRLYPPVIDFTVYESWPILVLIEGFYDGS